MVGTAALGHVENHGTTLETIEDRHYAVLIDKVRGRQEPTLKQLNIYTDNSKANHAVGAGFVIIKGKDEVMYV